MSRVLIEVLGGVINEIIVTGDDVIVDIIDHDDVKQATNFNELSRCFRDHWPVKVKTPEEFNKHVFDVFETYEKKLRNLNDG